MTIEYTNLKQFLSDIRNEMLIVNSQVVEALVELTYRRVTELRAEFKLKGRPLNELAAKMLSEGDAEPQEQPSEAEPRLMNAQEYALHVKVDVGRVYEWLKAGKLEHTRETSGGPMLIRSTDPRPELEPWRKPTHPRRYMLAGEYAKHVNVGKTTVENWLRRGKLTFVKKRGVRGRLIDSRQPCPELKVN